MKKLPRSFYLRPTIRVARDLLGTYLVRILNGKRLISRIVETEAYCQGDPASHAFNGRTRRNDVMFWKGGHLYVYFTYGMHYCANVVTGEEGAGEAVLIRAVEPLDGVDLMTRNRARPTGRKALGASQESMPAANLTNGPAKLCQALDIRREQDGTDLLGGEIYLLSASRLPASTIGRSKRIGIVKGTEKEWRFYVKGNAWVSKR